MFKMSSQYTIPGQVKRTSEQQNFKVKIKLLEESSQGSHPRTERTRHPNGLHRQKTKVFFFSSAGRSASYTHGAVFVTNNRLSSPSASRIFPRFLFYPSSSSLTPPFPPNPYLPAPTPPLPRRAVRCQMRIWILGAAIWTSVVHDTTELRFCET